MAIESVGSVPAHQPSDVPSYSVGRVADSLGIDRFGVYRLIQRKRVKATRAGQGKLSIPQTELSRVLKSK